MTASALCDEQIAPTGPALGNSFHTATQILPRQQCEAMFVLFAFCHAADDIADRTGPRKGRLAALERWRVEIERIYHGGVLTLTAWSWM